MLSHGGFIEVVGIKPLIHKGLCAGLLLLTTILLCRVGHGLSLLVSIRNLGLDGGLMFIDQARLKQLAVHAFLAAIHVLIQNPTTFKSHHRDVVVAALEGVADLEVVSEKMQFAPVFCLVLLWVVVVVDPTLAALAIVAAELPMFVLDRTCGFFDGFAVSQPIHLVHLALAPRFSRVPTP